MNFRAASLLVALTGFIALSLELVWTRLYYFLSATRAYAFATMLAAYLLGLAIGSLWSIRVQRRCENSTPAEQSASVARLVLWANIAGWALTPLVSWMAATRTWGPFQNGIPPYVFTYPLVALAAGWLGTLLPLICHFAVPPDAKVGSRLSKLYLANIVGAGAGSLLTGFVLMEYIPIRWISWLLLFLGTAIYVVLSSCTRKALLRGVAVVGIGAAATPPLYWQFWERLQNEYTWGKGRDFTQIIESRSGVITIDQEGHIYGGGAYDGVVDVSPVNTPWLVRAYALSAMCANPEEVLVVGLSGGSWAQITANNPAVKKVTCIEINHSYKEVIASHPIVSSLLQNPKVEIIIDDGRRWLERNPDRKFDAILMNTTHHWREFAGNLLSKEYLTMAAAHLNPGGVFQYNATDSLRVHQTALEVFDHVNLLVNNVVIWNGPPVFDEKRWRPVLENYTIDGKKVFDLANPRHRRVFDLFLALADTPSKEPGDLLSINDSEGKPLWPSEKERQQFRLQTRVQMQHACREGGASAITDDNLGHEYRWW